MKSWIAVLFAMALAGCTHSIHIANVSEFSPTFKPYNHGELVKARSEQFVIMGVVGNTNYVERAFAKLKSECPNGSIQGVVTQHSTSHGFFSWTNHIDMQGLCVRQ